MAMARNVCGIDKIVRIILAIALGIFAVVSDADLLWKLLAGTVAILAIATASIGFCPINRVLGINTCRLSEARSEKSGMR